MNKLNPPHIQRCTKFMPILYTSSYNMALPFSSSTATHSATLFKSFLSSSITSLCCCMIPACFRMNSSTPINLSIHSDSTFSTLEKCMVESHAIWMK